MRILFLGNIPSPYAVDFFNELGKLCDLTVLYERKQANNRDQNWKSHKLEHFKEVFLRGILIGNDSAICFSVFKYLKDKSYDLIVVGGYSTPTGMLAIKYLKAKKIPFILTADGGMIKNDTGYKMKLKRYFISSASAWLSTGEKTTKYLLHYGAKNEKIYRYPFTSLKNEDMLSEIVSKNEKLKLKSKLNIKEEKMVVSAGQFIYRKGYEVLLNACENIDKNIGIYIIGGEPTEEYLELKKNLNLVNVHFVSFKAKYELKEYYMAADLFVLPTREDIWGLVINEAMACGLPVITTDKCIAGLELVKDYESGFIVPVNDEKQLEEKMNIVLSDDGLREKMAKKSLDKIREYNIENMAQEHMKIFEKIVGESLINKKILIVSATLEGGGIGDVVSNIYTELFKKGINCDFVCYVKPSEKTINKLKNNNSNIYVIKSFSKSGLFKYIHNIRQVIKHNHYIAIHVHTSLLIWIACYAAKREHIPIRVGHEHGQKFLNYPEWILRLIERPFRFLNRKYCTHTIACSEPSGIYGFGKKTEFFPNFVDPDIYMNVNTDDIINIRKSLDIPCEAKIIGYVGCLDGIKNVVYFVSLLKKIRANGVNAYLVLAGQGESFENLKQSFKDTKMYGYVRMLGFRNDIDVLMHTFDAYVNPSLSEGMSMSIIQAQICKKTCVVSKGVPITNDIGVGLFKKCQSYEVDEWVDNITIALNKNINLQDSDIMLALINRRIDKESAISRLIEIYKV